MITVDWVWDGERALGPRLAPTGSVELMHLPTNFGEQCLNDSGYLSDYQQCLGAFQSGANIWLSEFRPRPNPRWSRPRMTNLNLREKVELPALPWADWTGLIPLYQATPDSVVWGLVSGSQARLGLSRFDSGGFHWSFPEDMGPFPHAKLAARQDSRGRLVLAHPLDSTLAVRITEDWERCLLSELGPLALPGPKNRVLNRWNAMSSWRSVDALDYEPRYWPEQLAWAGPVGTNFVALLVKEHRLKLWSPRGELPAAPPIPAALSAVLKPGDTLGGCRLPAGLFYTYGGTWGIVSRAGQPLPLTYEGIHTVGPFQMLPGIDWHRFQAGYEPDVLASYRVEMTSSCHSEWVSARLLLRGEQLFLEREEDSQLDRQ